MPWRRSPKCELLETRLALTVFTVNNLGDAPINNSDFVVTLRDAITAANNNVAAFPGGPVGDSLLSDTIRFEAGLAGTITLNQGELSVRSRMSISGPGAGVVTVASDMTTTRVFNVSNSMTSIVFVTIRDLTITGGRDSLGGGIINRESLRVENCIIIGNTATMGGGIYNADTGALTVVGGSIEANFGSGSALYNLGQATLSNSSIRNNLGNETGVVTNASSATLTIENSSIDDNDPNALCGGIHNSGALTIRGTTITNNKSQGGFVGGVLNDVGGTATLLNCTISGNSESAVGGVLNSSTMTLQNCTISEHTGFSLAGGVSNSGTMRLQNCTISGNQANIIGATGGVLNAYGATALTIENCTITQNRGGSTGGLDHESLDDATLYNTIVADNFKGSGSMRSDIFVVFPLNSLSSFNLVGVAINNGGGVGIVNGSNGNQVGVTNPRLGPLANNGGPTLTHALLAGSPAIDAGDPAAVAVVNDILPYDQRSFAFSRVIDGDGTGPPRIDIGAFELHTLTPATPALFGDYNQNGTVDAADYTLWRDTFGLSGLAAFSGADGDGNGVIGPGDYNVWRAHFGQSLPGAASNAASQESSAVTPLTTPANFVEQSQVEGKTLVTAAGEGVASPRSVAKAGVGLNLVSLAGVANFLQIRTRQLATGANERSVAPPRDDALLAWLSAPRSMESLLADEIGLSRHSNEDVTCVDGSERYCLDEIFASLASTRFFDF